MKYRIGWTFKEGIRNPPNPLTADTLKQRLEKHLREHDGFLYNYRLPLHSLQTKRKLRYKSRLSRFYFHSFNMINQSAHMGLATYHNSVAI